MTSSRNPVRFVILFIGRTGSTYLTQALSSHPEIAPGPTGSLLKIEIVRISNSKLFESSWHSRPMDGILPLVSNPSSAM
jgi:hypothetical protein